MRPLLLLSLALAACVQSDPASADVPEAVAPFAAVRDTSAGQPVEVGGVLPFRTLLPDGVTFVQTASDEGERTAFQIGGYDALVLFVPTTEAGVYDLRAHANLLAGDPDLVSARSPSGPFRWQADGRRHILLSDEHAGRQYTIIKSVSIVDTGRTAALARAIQVAWRWEPDGALLR